MDRQYLTVGTFATYAQALEAAKLAIDTSLRELLQPGMDAARLIDGYNHFGDVPMIFASGGDETPEDADFNPFEYAEARAREICR